MRLTEVAQTWLIQHINAGDSVVDATLGNGFDALFLGECVGQKGHVYGFDVQQSALQISSLKLAQANIPHTFYLRGHQELSSALPFSLKGNISAFMFNLGWLPGSDKCITTQALATIQALSQALSWLKSEGALSVMLYPGHDEGKIESEAVLQWLSDHGGNNITYDVIRVPEKPLAPILIQAIKVS